MQRNVFISTSLIIVMVAVLALLAWSRRKDTLDQPEVDATIQAETKTNHSGTESTRATTQETTDVRQASPTPKERTTPVTTASPISTNIPGVAPSLAITPTKIISNEEISDEDDLPLSLRISRPISGAMRGTLGVRGYDNVFYVTDNLEVQTDQVLTVTQGTWLVFPPGSRMDIRGKLVAEGNPVFPIHFISTDEVGWEGIHFHPSAGGSLCTSCRLENLSIASTALEVKAPITFKGGLIRDVVNGTAISSTVPLTVSNVVIDYVGTGLRMSGTDTSPQTISHLTITRCDKGIVNQGQSLTIDNSIITSCSTAVSTELSGTTMVRYTLFSDNGQDFTTGTGAQFEREPGLVYASPEFVDFPENFHLQPDSPAVNAADPEADYSREIGYNGGRADMGAYGNTMEATQQPPDDSRLDATFDTLLHTGDPGQTVTYTLTITHTGSMYDSYYLRARVNSRREFYIRRSQYFGDKGLRYDHRMDEYSKDFFDMQPGEQRQLEIGVQIPAHATNGMTNTTFINIGGGHGATPIEFELVTVVSTSTSIEQISHVDLPSQAVSIGGDYAYVAAGEDGLHVLDISNPRMPVEIGTYNQKGGAWLVAVKDNYAYVMFGTCEYSHVRYYGRLGVCNNDLYVLNVSDPATPYEVGFYELPEAEARSRWKKLEASGDYIYVIDGKGLLHILDISNPTALQKVHLLNTQVADFALANEHLYLLSPYSYKIKKEGDITSDSYLEIIDPISLTRIGSYQLAFGSEVTIIGHLAYIHTEFPCMSICTDITYSWHTVDISDPTAPQTAETAYLPTQAQSVAISDDYAYLADGKAGLRILDISDPTHPAEIDAFGAGQPGFAFDVEVSNGYIYLANGEGGFLILQYTTP
jgi:hypothetical protein